MNPLEKELELALLDLYEQWKQVGKPKTYFLQMVRKGKNLRIYKGPVGTVRYLINKPTLTDGFVSLVRSGKKHWTVESLILQPKWKDLFGPADLERARIRLKQAG